jgi:hypothetical protein
MVRDAGHDDASEAGHANYRHRFGLGINLSALSP